MLKRLLLLMLFAVAPTLAQSTNVSGTIADSNGQIFAGGKITVSFFSNNLQNFYWNGAPFNVGTTFTATLDSTGSFSGFVIPSSNFITPVGSAWTFQACPAATTNCTSVTIPVTGATMNVSSLVVPPPIQVNAKAYLQPSAYQDSEIVGPVVGFSYFNLTDNTLHVCTISLPCTWVSISGGGGGAGNPAAPAFALQIANGAVNAFATAEAGGVYLGVDNVINPTVLNVPLNESVAGPRPYIDPTNPIYSGGADPTGVADSTSAIQAAINVACTTTQGGAAIMLAGNFLVSQPQTGSSSTAPVFNIPAGCQGYGSGFFIYGNGIGKGSDQFSTPPLAKITVAPGANPSMGPVFYIAQPLDVTRFKDLALYCYNQCFQTYNAANVVLDNITALVTNTGQGIQHGAAFQADNVPVAFYDTFWIWLLNNCVFSQSSGTENLPTVLLAGVTPQAGGRSISGLMTAENGIWINGGVLYDQRVAQNAAPGTDYMKNIVMEMNGANSQAPFTIDDEVGLTSDFFGLIMDNVFVSDTSTPAPASVVLNAPYIYSDFEIRNVSGSLAGGPSIQINAGTMHSCSIQGSAEFGRLIVNSAGNPVGGCTSANNYGLDLFSAPLDTGFASQYYNTLLNHTDGIFGSNEKATPIRMAPSGSANSTLALDPTGGVMFGPTGTQSGYDAEVYRNALQSVGIRVALTTAPTSFVGTLASGGSLTLGTTYYTFVESTLVASTCLAANSTGPATELSFTPTVSGTQSFAETWTPVTDGNAVGYCVWLGTGPQLENQFFYVSGESSTGFTITTTGTAGTPALQNETFPSSPQFSVGLGGAVVPVGGITFVTPATMSQTVINANSGGTIVLGPGTYNNATWTLPDTGACVNLWGSGIGVTTLVALTSGQPMISKGNATAPYGCSIRDMSFNGNGIASSFVSIPRMKGPQLFNLEGDNLAASGTAEGFILGDGTSSVSYFYESTLINLDCEFTATNYPTASTRPTNCVDLQTSATDNQNIFGVVGRNTSNAAVRDYGDSNRIYNPHAYGTSQTYAPNYVVDTGGQAAIIGGECDGIILGCVNATGNLVTVEGMKTENFYAGTTPKFYLNTSGKTNYTVAMNDWSAFSAVGTTGLVSNANTGSGTGSIWGNYPDYGQNQMIGGAITLSQCSGCSTVTGLNIEAVSSSFSDYINFGTGTNKWQLGGDATSQNFSLTDLGTGNVRFRASQNAQSGLDSQSTAAVQFNMDANSGTGGECFGPGGATPAACVATIDSNGNFANNGNIVAQGNVSGDFVRGGGTAFTTSNVSALSGGWGSGSAVASATGFSQRFAFTITTGTGTTANPTLTITYPQTWPGFPIMICVQASNTTPVLTVLGMSSGTTTGMNLVMEGTPTANASYTFFCSGG